MKIIKNGQHIMNVNKLHNGKKGYRRSVTSVLATAFIYQHIIYRRTALFEKSLYQYPIKFISDTANPYIGFIGHHPNIKPPIAYDSTYVASKGEETKVDRRGVAESLMVNIVSYRYGVRTNLAVNEEAFMFGSIYQSDNKNGIIDMVNGTVGIHNNPSLGDDFFRYNRLGRAVGNRAEDYIIGTINTEELVKHRLLTHKPTIHTFILKGDLIHFKNDLVEGRETILSNGGDIGGDLAYLPYYKRITIDTTLGVFNNPEGIRVMKDMMFLQLSQNKSSRFTSSQIDSLFTAIDNTVISTTGVLLERNIKIKGLGLGPTIASQPMRSSLFDKGFLLLHNKPIGNQYPIEGLSILINKELTGTVKFEYKFSGQYSNAYYPSDEFYFSTIKKATGLEGNTTDDNYGLISDPELIKWRTASFISSKIGAGYHTFVFNINNQKYTIENIFVQYVLDNMDLGFNTALNVVHTKKVIYRKTNPKDPNQDVTIANGLPQGEYSVRVIGDLPKSAVTMKYDDTVGEFIYMFHDNTNVVVFELKVLTTTYRFPSFKNADSFINIFYKRMVSNTRTNIGCSFTDQENNYYGLSVVGATSEKGVISGVSAYVKAYTPPTVTEITTDTVTVTVKYSNVWASTGVFTKTITIYPN